MTRKYFSSTKDKNTLRKEYLILLKKHHPDKGGDLETCKAINNEYEYLFARCNATECSKPDSKMNYTEADALDKAIMDILSKIINLDGIEIEIIGYWVWVSGDTYPVKEILKEVGFKFSGSKKSWFHTLTNDTKKRFSCYKTLDSLREAKGSTKIETKKKKKIA
jgi:hypothetical protein